ncbi:MAG: GFA family protein [Gammaproteobacteria bacterium]
MSASPPFAGGCLCGAVRFRVTGPTKWCAHCHCTLCRRAHGAAFVTWVGLEDVHFKLDSDPTLAWYESTPGAQRGFCSRCGTTLLFRSARWPGEMHVTRAAFDGDIDRAPAGHAYFSTHVEWARVDDDLPVRR